MILSEEDINTRLASEDNIVNLLSPVESHIKVIPRNDSGVGDRGPAVPDLIRKLIANVTNQSDETKTEVADVFGVGVPEVSKYSRGLVHNRLDTELKQIADKSTGQKTESAHNLALDNLILSLGEVTARMPEASNLKEAAKIAVDMSRVVSQLRPKEEEASKVKTLVVIKMGNQKEESQYQTIDI